MKYSYKAECFFDQFSRNFLWINGFSRNVCKFSGKIAMTDPIKNKTWTYQELNRESNRLANMLLDHGFCEGDILLYQLYNSPQFAFCYIAAQKLGGINSPVNFNLSPGETAQLLDRERPKIYIYDCDTRQTAWRALELCKNVPPLVIAVDYHGQRPWIPKDHYYYEDLVALYDGEEPEASPESDLCTEVTRLYTSGTTGVPKSVPVNNANEILSAHDTIMNLSMTSRDITMNLTPWFHRGGLHSGGITTTFYAGASLVIMRMFSARKCSAWVQKYGVTFLTGVPAALEKLAEWQEKHPADFSGLKGIITMGSPLNMDDCIRYRRLLSPNIFNGYGTTETFWNSFLMPYDLPDKAGSAGMSCMGDDIRVVHIYDEKNADPEDTVPMDGKTQGEIIIYSCEKSSQSYGHDVVQTKERYNKGWFFTRDIGTWDEDHFITVVDRKDNMIITMGENIYPNQIEEIIRQHEKVFDCMVASVPDQSRGQVAAAYILRKDDSLTVREIHQFCASHDNLSGYQCPKYYRFVTSLPYNASGKKQHGVLRKQAADDYRAGLLKRP